MYQDHFGLIQPPFSIAPDPNFLFLSSSHQEALAHLMYGFAHGGFVLITGEVGTGKTTLLRNLLDRTPPDLDVAFILNPRLTVRELLETICDELGVVYKAGQLQSVKQYIDVLNKHLLQTHQAGRSTVVIIDEAQNLSPAVLEQIRLLTNLETNEKKLLRIILLGQPELGVMLDRTELRQLAQRITARYHLVPLSREDVSEYLAHRLARAGGNPGIFTRGAVMALYSLSKGTPRLINVIADRAMLGAYAQNRLQVDAALVRTAAREVLGKRALWQLGYPLYAGIAVVLIAAAMIWAYATRDDTPPASAVSASQSETLSGTLSQQDVAKAIDVTPIDDAALGAAALAVSDDDATTTVQDTYTPVAVVRPPRNAYILQREAFAKVFARWGATYAVNSSQVPCDFAPSVGLQCLSRKGGWSEVVENNTPVVLELWDEADAPFYAALVAKEGQQYVLDLDGVPLRVTPKDLRDAWFGAYVLLWQAPPNYIGSLRAGDTHPSVHWLGTQLLSLGTTGFSGPASDYFDDALHDAVLAFQAAESLLADGIVGPLTWIRLTERLDADAPRLVH